MRVLTCTGVWIWVWLELLFKRKLPPLLMGSQLQLQPHRRPPLHPGKRGRDMRGRLRQTQASRCQAQALVFLLQALFSQAQRPG